MADGEEETSMRGVTIRPIAFPRSFVTKFMPKLPISNKEQETCTEKKMKIQRIIIYYNATKDTYFYLYI